MQNDVMPQDGKSLIVPPEPMKLVLSEAVGDQFALVFPPLEDLFEIGKVTGRHFSLHAHVEDAWTPFKSAFAFEFDRLQEKRDLFGESRTFITHLANLAEMAGMRDAEYGILSEVPANARDSFTKRLIAENLLARGEVKEAETLFSSLDLSNDVAANLRLAFLHVQRNELGEAEKFVSRAVAIDPLNYASRLFEGALRLAKRQINQAIQSFRIAQEERPTSSVLFTNMAIAYIHAAKNEKALAALRRAVALDPLNQNAVSIFADISNKLGHDEDAVPALRYFVSLEQRSPAIWGRLARALLAIRKPDEALEALRRQASQEDTPAVWNNIGVARAAGNRRSEALSAFKYAIQKVKTDTEFDGLLAVRNALAMLAEERSHEDVIRLAKLTLSNDGGLSRRDKRLGDIYVFMLRSMRQAGHNEEATRISEQLLLDSVISSELRVWIVAQLLAYYSIIPAFAERAVILARESISVLGHLDSLSDRLQEVIVNNMAFAFAEHGHLDELDALLPHLSKHVHNKAYPTATLGLIHFRKGRFESGVGLYEEAMRLAGNTTDKVRIRQKLYLEQAFHFQSTEPRRAERLLKKVEGERDGSSELREMAHKALSGLGLRNI